MQIGFEAFEGAIAESDSSYEQHNEMALELFRIAKHHYTVEEFSLFSTLFLNPLCQTMFRARFRTFSDYEKPDDPLTQERANDVIARLILMSEEREKIECFFEAMREIKPMPYSQRDTIEYRYGSMHAFLINLTLFHLDSYKRDHVGVDRLQVYEHLKYEIASGIEKEDFYTRLGFKDLMAMVKDYLDLAMSPASLHANSMFTSSPRKRASSLPDDEFSYTVT